MNEEINVNTLLEIITVQSNLIKEISKINRLISDGIKLNVTKSQLESYKYSTLRDVVNYKEKFDKLFDKLITGLKNDTTVVVPKDHGEFKKDPYDRYPGMINERPEGAPYNMFPG